MMPLEKIIVLNKVPLFSTLKTEDIYMISTIAMEEAYEAGHELFHEGDLGDRLYIVVTGSVLILKDNNGKEIQLVTLRENDFLGEMTLFDAEIRSATARCVENSTFLVIERNDIEQLSHEYPGIALGFVKVLSKRLRDMNESKH